MSLKHRSIPKTALYKKFRAGLMSCGLGGALLLGFVLFKEQNSNVAVVPSPSAPISAVPAPANRIPAISALEPIPDRVPSRPVPSDVNPRGTSELPVTAGNCGDSGGNGDVLYPVLINHADVEQLGQQHCQHAIAKTSDHGTSVFRVASFTDRQRAQAFAQKVGGKVGQPYQSTPLPSTNIDASALPSPSSPAEAEIDATIPSHKDNNDTGSSSNTSYRLAPFVFASPSTSSNPANASLSNTKSP
jgi:hypothetical protein